MQRTSISPIRTPYLTQRPISPSTLPVELKESPLLQQLRKNPAAKPNESQKKDATWDSSCHTQMYNKYHATDSVFGGVHDAQGRVRDITCVTRAGSKIMSDVRAYEETCQIQSQKKAQVQQAHWERLRAQQTSEVDRVQQVTFIKKRLRAARLAAAEERVSGYIEERDGLYYDALKERAAIERNERQRHQEILREQWTVHTTSRFNARRQRLQENEHVIRMEACGFFIFECEAKFRLFIGKHAAITRTALIAEERSQRVSKWKFLSALYSWRAEQEAENAQLLSLERRDRSRVADEEANGFAAIDQKRMDLVHEQLKKQRLAQEAILAATKAIESEHQAERRTMDGKDAECRATIRSQEATSRIALRQSFDLSSTAANQAAVLRENREKTLWVAKCAEQQQPILREEGISRASIVAQRNAQFENIDTSARISWEDASGPFFVSHDQQPRQPVHAKVDGEIVLLPLSKEPFQLPDQIATANGLLPVRPLTGVTLHSKIFSDQDDAVWGCELRSCNTQSSWGDFMFINRDDDGFQSLVKKYGLKQDVVCQQTGRDKVILSGANEVSFRPISVEWTENPVLQDVQMSTCKCECPETTLCHTVELLTLRCRGPLCDSLEIVNALFPLVEFSVFGNEARRRVISATFDLEVNGRSAKHQPVFVALALTPPILHFEGGNTSTSCVVAEQLENSVKARSASVVAPFASAIVSAPVSTSMLVVFSTSIGELNVEGQPRLKATANPVQLQTSTPAKATIVARNIREGMELSVKFEEVISSKELAELVGRVMLKLPDDLNGEAVATLQVHCGAGSCELTSHFVSFDTSTRGLHLKCDNPTGPVETLKTPEPLRGTSVVLVPARSVVPPFSLVVTAATKYPVYPKWGFRNTGIGLDTFVSVMNRPPETIRSLLAAKRKPPQVGPAKAFWAEESPGKWVSFSSTLDISNNPTALSTFPTKIAVATFSTTSATITFITPSFSSTVEDALSSLMVQFPNHPIKPAAFGLITAKLGNDIVFRRTLK